MGGKYCEEQEGGKKKKETIGVPLAGNVRPFYMIADSAFRAVVDALAALHAGYASAALLKAFFAHRQGRADLDAALALHALLFVDPHVKDVYLVCERLHGAERA